MFVMNKIERKCFVNYFCSLIEEEKKSFNLHINENYYEDIITSISFDLKILN